jgi:hypothetical protein
MSGSYLMIVPGLQLAAIYDRWGARLLEANVRSFLQARAKTNKGIQKTIRDEPLGHPVEKRLDHQDAAGVCFTPDVSHQVLVVFLKLAHRRPRQKAADAPSPRSCGTGRRRT